MQASASQVVPDVLAQTIVSTLHAQRWSLDQTPQASLHRVVLFTSGQGALLHADGERAMRASEVLWLPGGQGRSLSVRAGSSGLVAGFSDALLAAAIGTHADSLLLRHMTARVCTMSVQDAVERDELLHALQAIARGSRQAALGSWHYLSAHLAIVLVLLWRLSGTAGAVPEAGHSASLLQRFRHLVEAQYRDHWTIARYAHELALTPDGLHDLCRRKLGRMPSELVHQRLVREACVLLGESAGSVGRVGSELGFGSASHFSRFFKRWMGASPRAYREQSRRQAAQGLTPRLYGYADWP